MTSGLRGDEPDILLFVGTDGGEPVATALAIDVPRAVELGAFNTIRYAFGGVYVMTTTIDGATVVRHELP